MRFSFSAVALFTTIGASLFVAAPSASARQSDRDRFELRGTVVNAATGEPVSGALVQLGGDKGAFSDSDGAFAFNDLLRGQFSVTARKPGFFDAQELNSSSGRPDSMTSVPSASDLLLKLTPEGIMYGDVRDQSDQPIENVSVEVRRWQVQEGRRHLGTVGIAVTDDEGNFRIAELMPASYYLSFFQLNSGGIFTQTRLTGKHAKEEGYGRQFYPGVSEASSATAIQVRAGAPVHIAQILALSTSLKSRELCVAWVLIWDSA
jgi:hypothetical protein